MYEERKYRNLFKADNLVFFDVCWYETDLRIGACRDLTAEALDLVIKYRRQLDDYIRCNPGFLTSLVPLKPADNAPVIVKRMCEASAKAGVGPMAAVAGAFSEFVGRELLTYSGEIMLENGGDIFIKSLSLCRIGIYAGSSPLNQKLALEIRPESTPLGICTSSGTIGHSLSFGRADAAVIISKDTFLADAAATKLGNLVKEPGDIEKAMDEISAVEGVLGAVVIIGDKLGVWGDVKLTAFNTTCLSKE